MKSPVAKFMNTIHKPSTQVNRKKEAKFGYRKHKGDNYEQK